MKTCIECGRPLNAGSSAGTGGVRCMICKTARGLRLPVKRRKHTTRVEFVREIETGAQGHVLRRVWLVDVKGNVPAELAYIVKFDDGREKRMLRNEIELLKGGASS